MWLHKVVDCTCSLNYSFHCVIISLVLVSMWAHSGSVQFCAIMKSVAATVFMAVHVIWAILRYEKSRSWSILMLSFGGTHQFFKMTAFLYILREIK